MGRPRQTQTNPGRKVGGCALSPFIGHNDNALAILYELEAEHAALDSVDGYVFEEIAENLAALGKLDEAKPHFERAFSAATAKP